MATPIDGGEPNDAEMPAASATTEHFQKLYRYSEEVVCCFDGDAAGRRAAWKALENALSTLTDGRQLKFMFLPDGEDPGAEVHVVSVQRDRLCDAQSGHREEPEDGREGGAA